MSFENIGKRETLPEKVSRAIKESILTGEMKGGDVLPTEPELEKQFGVSRAVIRDAVRMLKAQGLIDVKHGKGMYVTHSQLEAFNDALLTTLRRDRATAWDAEQFEQIFLPQVFALAAKSATADKKTEIRKLGENYLAAFQILIELEKEGDEDKIGILSLEVQEHFKKFMVAVFDATDNKMVKLMGQVSLSMRKFRNITGLDPDDARIEKAERISIERYIQAVESPGGIDSVELVSSVLNYGGGMAEIMKKTPIGTIPEIPGDVFFSAYKI